MVIAAVSIDEAPGMGKEGEFKVPWIPRLEAEVWVDDRVMILEVRRRFTRPGALEGAESPDEDPSPLRLAFSSLSLDRSWKKRVLSDFD